MASLTHVCVWSGKGWKRITAEEAARLHPYGTVSAHSGLFMCELCGQYVLLTDSHVQARHFRHSSSEKSKDCPERTFGQRATYEYSKVEHELPIRITNITNRSFELEMGFIHVPEDLLTSQLRIKIKSGNDSSEQFTYVKERLNADRITYLPIGRIPRRRYSIDITGAEDTIRNFWPKIVQGVDSEGTIFDAKIGKKLVYDSDVTIGKKYYLLRKGSIYGQHSQHVSCREISCQSVLWEIWHVYEIMANDYNEESARFFLNYHCRLTEQPVSIQPVWPVYVENPYVIKHNQKSMILHIEGNAPTTQIFPPGKIRKYSCNKGSVFEIDCNNKQQLISTGRTKELQYTYFWKEPLNRISTKPVVTVRDLNDFPVDSGEKNELPYQRSLRISIPYDGMLMIKQGGILVEKKKLHAKTFEEIDNIKWNMELEISVGLDIIWKVYFLRINKSQVLVSEIEILQRLKSYSGLQIPIPHTIASLTSRLHNYPLIRRWLYKCIRKGNMSERAYRNLQTWIRDLR